MAHEGLVIFMMALGVILLLGFLFGPNRETRLVKRTEGKIMLIPSTIIMFIIAIIIFSGVLG